MSATGLPELDVARVRRWCAARVPDRARHQVRIECDMQPGYLTIAECRAPWHDDPGGEWTRSPIARLHYTKTSSTWALYWRDRNQRFHVYEHLSPTANIEELISGIECDPTGIFWG